jgi:hypothetical protein
MCGGGWTLGGREEGKGQEGVVVVREEGERKNEGRREEVC